MGAKPGPLRLRPTAYPAAGAAGELFPVVGRAEQYQTTAGVLAHLSHPGQYHGESPGIVEAAVGQGRVVAWAFDLPLCVLLLRQGDPARAEQVPAEDGCARPSHLACEIGPNDAAWMPYADLLARFLVDLVRRWVPAPVPLFSHLPGNAPGILLYSGDEDGAEVAWNEEEFAAVTANGGRMSLYLIPTNTKSTRTDGECYGQHHDLGPHPNLRPLDRCPVAERVAEFERQVRLFEQMFAVKARSLRNHCTAWAGYLELVEVMEKCGVLLDGNYFSGMYLRDRVGAPYAAFGGAMPMRFCQPDGRLYEVFQQHTHASDDVLFGAADYSYKLAPQTFATELERIFADIATRFHTPYAVCIHPSNWVQYSRAPGEELLRQARERAFPIWSFDQWLGFWEARDTWQLIECAWEGNELRCVAEGAIACPELSLVLPASFGEKALSRIAVDGRELTGEQVRRHGEPVVVVRLPVGACRVSLWAKY
ncbi:MAG: hypothetical protein FJY97_04855 [candidate division Zixibacteria bacterium]|nr:hypothetical protein [candidate division Zixibacteria bacterium]